MESGTCFEFPPFEGKYSHLNDYPVDVLYSLPYHPRIDQVYVLHGTDGEAVKSDGWIWARPNKSNKLNFVNIPHCQKALKYKCSEYDCPAVKFVDSTMKYDMSRVYYESEHKHENKKEKIKPKEISNLKRKYIDESDEDDRISKKQTPIKSIPTAFKPTFSSTPFSFEKSNTNAIRRDNPEAISLSTCRISSPSNPKENLNVDQQLKENKKLKVQLKATGDGAEQLKKENDLMSSEIRDNISHIQDLKEKRNDLKETLQIQEEEKEILLCDNKVLEISINRGMNEIDALKNKNIQLKQKLKEHAVEENIVSLDQQIVLLESLIEEKKLRYGNQTGDVQVLQESLNICSDKKKEAERKKNSNILQNVSRNLMESFECPEIAVQQVNNDHQESELRSDLIVSPKQLLNVQDSPAKNRVDGANKEDAQKEFASESRREVSSPALPTDVLADPNDDTLIQSLTTCNDDVPEDFMELTNEDLDCTISFYDRKLEAPDNNLKLFDRVVEEEDQRDTAGNNFAHSFRVCDNFWSKDDLIQGPILHGHSGKAVFQLSLDKQKKLRELKEIDDGRSWSKKKTAVKTFEGCTDHRRYYQDCIGHFVCPNEACTAKQLFSKPSQNFVKNMDKLGSKQVYTCSSCDFEMMYKECLDYSVMDKYGKSPKSRRYLDFDYCHGKLLVKYVGTHSCHVSRRISPMDVEFVEKYFRENPGNTASKFKDFVINKAINEDHNVEEVSLQYADINKIRQIMMKQKKLMDPDGSGSGFLKRFSESIGNRLNDKYLLTVIKTPKMFIVSSNERLKVAAMMSDSRLDSYESASIDFCESQFKGYSVMEVTTYSGELRQLVPMFSIVFEKPGENADNVCAALLKIDEILIDHSNTKFNPLQWTTDNSGALENGIIRAKGTQDKPFLASDKLHDMDNINRVIKTVPSKAQFKVKDEILKMMNGAVPSVSENIYQCLINKAKSLQSQRLLRSLQFNYRKRHKYWNCYRQVQDNNATSEQVNRVMTRHGKGEGLVDGVQRMVRMAIGDKAKFQLAADGKIATKGPTVKDRNVRVERGMLRGLPQVVSSIEEELNSQTSTKDDRVLQEKALADFQPKSSDTHRSDKKRNILKSRKVSKPVFKKQYLIVKKSLKFRRLTVLGSDVDDNEVSVTFNSGDGLENVVNISTLSVLCTCEQHADKHFCPEIVKFFVMIDLEDLAQKKSFSNEEFALIVEKARLITVSFGKEAEWLLSRPKRKVKCSSCEEPIEAGNLAGKFKKLTFHPTRVCLPREVSSIKAKVDTELSAPEVENLQKNGVKIQVFS